MLSKTLSTTTTNVARKFRIIIWKNMMCSLSTMNISKRDGSVGQIDKNRGFIEIERNPDPYRDPEERLQDWGEINSAHDPVNRTMQAARCMDCGTPFCQTNTGCPVNNLIPEWNDLVYRGQWKEAVDRLHATNNFPEFTGRVCPAPCEGACVAGLVDSPVTIKNIEYAIIDHAFEQGWVKPSPPKERTGKKVAIVGSGPAGLAAADELNKLGHDVTIFEREDRIGGLLVYGIPNMKLSKDTVKRRLDLLETEGIKFVTNAEIGVDIDAQALKRDYDATVLAVGATKPRDLDIPGRDLKGVHFAMEFLTKNQKRLLVNRDGQIQSAWDGSWIDAKDKNVVVVGGGDTGTDCIGSSLRMGCSSIVNFELMGQPPAERAENNPWPEWPHIMRVDYGHAEAKTHFGADPRIFGVMTKEAIGDDEGNVKALVTVDVEFVENNGKKILSEIHGSEREHKADLVLLSMGFVSPEPTLMNAFHFKTDKRKNFKATHGSYGTSIEGLFTAGDCRRGQSLVVWAINEGRGCSDEVDAYLKNL